jgi:hypothetical protein
MQYALLFYLQEPTPLDSLPEPERTGFLGAMNAAIDAMREAGVFVGSQRLHPVESAACVRVRGDRTLVTDGPFAETKECLAGFFVIEVEDREKALGWAARMPVARAGTVEVRALRECG